MASIISTVLAAQLIGKDLNSLKIVSCHLGNGCSVTRIRAGRSVNTTMGFTPLEGLMMGTRSGSVDPGILIFLMRQHGLNADQIDDMLNKKSGLLGMHLGNGRAKLAFDLYVHACELLSEEWRLFWKGWMHWYSRLG